METWCHTVAEFVNMQNPGRMETSCICPTFRCPVSISAVLSGMLGVCVCGCVCVGVWVWWRYANVARRLCAKDYRYHSSWKSHSVQYTCVPKVCGLFLILQTLLDKLYVFFWVIPRRLNCICRRFGTHCLFHLHRQVCKPACVFSSG